MGTSTRVYLVGYNVVCCLLWAYLGLLLLIAPEGGLLSPEGLNPKILWTRIAPWLMAAQTLALMECVHSVLGIVRSPFITTCMQVLSRLHMIWILWRLVPEARDTVAIVTTVGAWAAVELIRYPYYAVNTAMAPSSSAPQWLTWLRYSAFVVLYPVGICSEVRCVWVALHALKRSRVLRAYPVPMPNLLNFEIDLYFLYWCLLFIYIPGLIHLYGHMFAQRAKALGGGVTTKKTD